jgi:hypothetical protein
MSGARPLLLFTPAAGAARRGDLVVTDPLRSHRRGADVLRKVRYVRRFFPELDDLVLRIGLTRRAAGFADLEGEKLWLNPNRLSMHTITHELVHLLQARSLVPSGERSCDLFALARDASLVDALPFYLKLPAQLGDERGWLRPGTAVPLHRLAEAAVTRRSDGHRQYIRWFEREAEKLAPAGASRCSPSRPIHQQISLT